MPANDLQTRYLQLAASSDYLRSVIQPGREVVGFEYYAYNAVIGTAALPLSLANGAQQTTLETQADSDFVVTSLSACVNITANGDMKVNRNLTLQIQDTSTGKLFFSQPTVMTLVAGGGGFPFIFPSPRVVRANTTLLLTGQNRDTAVNYNQMFVSLGGTRIYYK